MLSRITAMSRVGYDVVTKVTFTAAVPHVPPSCLLESIQKTAFRGDVSHLDFLGGT